MNAANHPQHKGTSQNQVRRLLSLVPYLREHDGVSLTEVAATFNVSEETLRGDLNVLWMCGMPGLMPGDLIEIDMDAVDGAGVIHLSNADYLTRPLRLAADEALAVVLALRTLREVVAGPDRAAIDSALVKLEAATGSVTPSDRASVTVTAAREEIQARITDALRRGRRLDLTYDVASRAETTRRYVDPLRVFVLEGYGYLDAWCYSAGGLRTFRLDRIAAVEVTDMAAEEHPGVVLKDLSVGWFDALKDAPLVTLELQPWATWIAEYYPTESVVPHGGAHNNARNNNARNNNARNNNARNNNGGATVTLRVTDPAWLRGLLLRLGGGARVVAPADAGKSAVEAAQEALDQYAALY